MECGCWFYLYLYLQETDIDFIWLTGIGLLQRYAPKMCGLNFILPTCSIQNINWIQLFAFRFDYTLHFSPKLYGEQT